MLRCEECSAAQDQGVARFHRGDPGNGEGPQVATYCPPCADRELRPVDYVAGYA
jgi:hypothetical protein